ncbi:MAG: hypothetical protein V4792_10040 [Pseudomonadota bacterium]
MTTIVAGATGTYTYTASAIVAVSLAATGAARMTVTRGAAVIRNTLMTHAETVGPFLTGDVMTIFAQAGNVDYTITPFTFPVDLDFDATSGACVAGSTVLALSETVAYTKVTATATVKSSACEFAGFDVIAGGSSGTITVYDATSASAGAIVFPTTALTTGQRVEFAFMRALATGCHVVIGGSGVDVNVLVN